MSVNSINSSIRLEVGVSKINGCFLTTVFEGTELMLSPYLIEDIEGILNFGREFDSTKTRKGNEYIHSCS